MHTIFYRIAIEIRLGLVWMFLRWRRIMEVLYFLIVLPARAAAKLARAHSVIKGYVERHANRSVNAIECIVRRPA